MDLELNLSSIFDLNPLPHILVAGSTGTGKTNDCKNLVYEAVKKGFTVLVIDPKGEYLDLVKAASKLVESFEFSFEEEDRRFLWNPLQPPSGVDLDVWAKTFSDVFTRSYGLSDPSRRILYDSLMNLYLNHGVYEGFENYPTLRELEEEVSKFNARSHGERNSKIALENRIHIVASGSLGDSISVLKGYALRDFDGKLIALDLSSISSIRDQRFLVEVLIASIWEFKKRNREDRRVLIVLEEAHRYVPEERPSIYRGDRTLIELAVAEGRTFGLHFIVADQMPSLLSKYVSSNCGVKIVHRLDSIEQIEAIAKSIGIHELDYNLMNEVKSMETGKALITLPGLSDPVKRLLIHKMPEFKHQSTSDHVSSFPKLERRNIFDFHATSL